MGIEFTKPIWLMAFVVVVLFLVFTSCKTPPSFRKRVETVLRSIVCGLVILAMAGMSIGLSSGRQTCVYVVDVSDSASGASEEARTFLQESLSSTNEQMDQGVVTFGQWASVAVEVGEELPKDLLGEAVAGAGTNWTEGLQVAGTLLPSHGKKHVVVLTDGVETTGEALAAARQLQAQGVTIDGYLLQGVPEKEVQLTALHTPDYVDGNTAFSVEAEVYATVNTTATLRIYRGSSLMVQEEVQLSSGNHFFTFQDSGEGQGALLYRAEVESRDDTWYQNNQAYAYTYVEDVPAVLLVDNGEGSSREMEKLLNQSGLRVQVLSPSQVPQSLEELSVYDGVLLSNVPANALSSAFLSSLEQFVKTSGNGLLVTGGDKSYALGGYQNTVLSDLLPVEMELKTEGEQPDLAMIMVIDHSGSMAGGESGISPMGMAKEAAVRAVEELSDTDWAGVLAFDSNYTWVVEPALVGENRQDMIGKINTIVPAGGTSILPALQEAYDAINKLDARKKHIILLTDGQAEQTGYDGVINRMNTSGITLSTVAVGGGADIRLLSSLAQRAGGRYYYTDAFSDLPEIFATETVLAGQEYIKEGTFFPETAGSSTLLAGIDALPALDGYVGSTAKPRADVVLQSETGEPLLSQWQYGLGKVIAWMSDTNGLWSSQYLASEQGQTLLRNLVSAATQTSVGKDTTFTGRTEGGTGILRAEMGYDAGVSSVSGVAVNMDNEEIPLTFTAVEPGVYEASSAKLTEGSYQVQLELEQTDGTKEYVRGGVYFSYSPEYDVTKMAEGEAKLRQVVSLTGGRMLTSSEDTLTDVGKEAVQQKELWPWLLTLALLLFLVDIAFRRFAVLGLWLERQLGRWKRKKETAIPGTKPEAAAKPTAEPKESTAQSKAKNKKQKTISQPSEEKKGETGKPASTMDVLMAKKKKRNS